MTRIKVLVTGATGFIGASLVRRLTAAGVETSALVRSTTRAAALRGWGAQLCLGDLRDAATLRRATAGTDVVVHAAAWVGAGGDPREIEATNVGGTRSLLEAAVNAGVRRFVYLSSTGVYGALQREGIDETQAMRRTGLAYHDSKIAAEEVVLAERRLWTVRLRPSHVWGPGSTHFTMRPLRMLLRGPVPVVAGGRYRFKPLHIDNLLDAIERCLEQELPSAQALNLTDGYTRSWRELFEAYAQAAGVPLRLRSIPLPVARLAGWLGDAYTHLTGRAAPLSGETVRVLSSANSYDHTRAKAALRWTPEVDWQRGMEGVERWFAGLPRASLTGPQLPLPLEVL